MPLPISKLCQARLFGLASSLGEIRSEVLRHNNLDKAQLVSLGRDVVALNLDCQTPVLDKCAGWAQEVLLGIATAHQAPEGDQAAKEARLGYITPMLMGLVGCIMDNYHLAVEEIDDGPFNDWPTGDFDWLQVVKPNRKVVR